ncbi:MAG TPA: HDIG domain-containing metalloprotein [Candidatus Paceibacterota bacterium]
MPEEKLEIDKHRELLYAQEPRILETTAAFSSKIRSFPLDPKCHETEPRALIVGGFVRDSMMGLYPKDADIEVYGVSAERLEEALLQLFPGQLNLVGKSFGILKVSLGEGLELDISIPRRESQTGPRHGDATVEGDPSMSTIEAARRRDFTWNALGADILTGEVIDPFGGLADLENKILRATDPERFIDDPLRVWRAIQFIGRYNFEVDQNTFYLMQGMVFAGKLDHLPKERTTEEIKKLLLKGSHVSRGLETAKSIGIIERYFPELAILEKTEQEPEWHPEGNVWIHTLMALDVAAKLIREDNSGLNEEDKLSVMLGTLCHDLGKPSTTEMKDGKVRSHGHAEAGIEPTRALLSKFAFSGDIAKAAEIIASDHLKPGTLYREFEKGNLSDKQYTNAVRKLIKRIAPLSPQVLITASEADSRGRTLPDVLTKPYNPGIKMLEAIESGNLTQEAKTGLVMGRDIITISKSMDKELNPGPQFGLIIAQVEQARDNGTISTRDEALKMLVELIEQIEPE